MGTPDRSFAEIVDIVKSWFPRRTEPANVSRVFWMPDHSCRVCYDCDSQFTIFNRRHHCRLCGRVFCAKCTSNSVPAPCYENKGSQEELEKVRVCNFCFKQREKEIAAVNNGSGLSPSSSMLSLSSIKSAGANDSSNALGSLILYGPYLTGQYQKARSTPDVSPPITGSGLDKPDMLVSGANTDSGTNISAPSSNQFGFCINRGYDDDDGYSAYHSDSETRQFHQSADYYGPVEFGDTDNSYGSDKDHHSQDNFIGNDLSSPRPDSTDSQASLTAEKLAEEVEGHDNSEDCDVTSSIYGAESTDADPVDFENNGLLWLPPEPEDEEDEREADLSDDEEDFAGDWKNLHHSSSFGSGEYRSRDRSSEEHRKAMNNVVGGHFRALVAQLLQVENLLEGEEDDEESWLDIITSLSWEAATLLKPDTSKGGGMDPGGYVKVKCLACGRRSESMVVKGIVCKKNIAHRRMKSKLKGPRFLILGGALEYQRVTNLLSSFDTLLQQEMDHLKMAVAKIDAQEPDVLLVEKSVSRHAQECLLAKDISLVLNVKRPLLERIARCTGAQIVPSIDQMSSQKLGSCELFHVDKFLEEHGSAGQSGKKLVKTLMFFGGCPKPLGCTVLLRGANGDELKKVKHVIQYGIFAAYHLALETSFLADEGASLPDHAFKSPITVTLPDKQSSVQRSISTIPGFQLPAAAKPQPDGDIQRPNGVHTSDLTLTSNNPSDRTAEVDVSSYTSKGVGSQIIQNSVAAYRVADSQSPGVLSPLVLPGQSFLRPYYEHPLYHASIEKTANYFKQSYNVEDLKANSWSISDDHNFSCTGSMHRDILEGVSAVHDINIDERKKSEIHSGFSDQSSFHADHNCIEDRAAAKEEFPPSPSDHQSILVSLSTRCVWKGTVCERAHLFRIKYYGSFDKPLGRFLRDHLFDLQGSLTISVRKLPEIFLPGERDGKIWMWHRCLRCPRTNGFPPATRRIVMSDAAWGLSFGKFLELSFSNHAAASRVASCGHSLHRDCLRFYGFGKMVACFRYASIDVHSVYLPPFELDFDLQVQEWIQTEFDEVANKKELLFSEVSNALQRIAEKKSIGMLNSDMEASESRNPISEVEGMLHNAKANFEESLKKTLKKQVKMGQPILDILEINRLRRQLLSQSIAWEQCLITVAHMDNALHVEAGGSIGKYEKLADVSLASKSNMISAGSDLPVPDVSKGTVNVGHSEKGLNYRKGSHGCLFTSVNSGDQLSTPEPGDGVCRTLSEGQFPIKANLSDKLDAAWTGEGHSGSTMPQEKFSRVLNSLGVDSSVVREALVPVSDLGEHSCNEEDNGDMKFEKSLMSTMPALAADPVQDITSWIDKNSGDRVPRFDSHSESNPVYVFSLRELERQCGARLRLPVGLNGTVVPVYDDEPASIISHALVSLDYQILMSDEREKLKDNGVPSISSQLYDPGIFRSFQSFDETSIESFRTFGSMEDNLLSVSASRSSLISDPLLDTKSLHVRVSFMDELAKVKYTVTCYYAKHFDNLRRTCCPCELDFVRSLGRCKKWGAQGGKSNVFFAKSLDDRFIIKQSQLAPEVLHAWQRF
ncbi:hypothetical protein ACLOJK_025866 [Asimina triloba]